MKSSLPYVSVTALLGLSFARAAAAAELPAVQTWTPIASPNALHVTESTSVAEEGVWGAALYMGYAHRPLVLTTSAEGAQWAPIQSSLGGALTGSVGIGARFELGALLPFDMVQTQQSGRPDGTRVYALPASGGLGDLSVRAKYALRPNPVGGLGIAIVAESALPTGARGTGTAEREWNMSGRLIADYSLLLAGAQMGAGYTWRSEHREWLPGVVHGDALPWHLALWGRVGKPLGTALEHRVELAVRGELPVRPGTPLGLGDTASASLSPTLLSAALSWALNKREDLRLLTAVETGLVDAPGAPALRTVLGLSFTPHVRDADGDGIGDEQDACVQAREDFDGFQDEDGCPDADNDGDGFGDQDDACPNQPGVASEDPRHQGCPEPDADGDGVPDDDDACPKERGASTSDECNGCPSDKDDDGVYDVRDRCPDAAEDKDGFEDEDGCPEADNDRDGLRDVEDHCPMQAGVYSPLEHESGCPEEVRDADHDLVADALDQCPDKPETWNGNQDADGCPDAGNEPIWWDFEGDDPGVAGFTRSGRNPANMRVSLRALAVKLRREPALQSVSMAYGAAPGLRDPLSAKQIAELEAVARELSLLARVRIGVEHTLSPLQGKQVGKGNGLIVVFGHFHDPDHKD